MSEPRRRPRRWLVVVAVVWALILAGGAAWAIGHGRATAREQTTIEQARPAVDRAIADLAVAAAGDGRSVVAISGFERVAGCRITVFRQGARYERSLTVLVPVEEEAAVLDRVARALPARFDARVYGGPAPRLVADPGDYVAVAGRIQSPGEIRFVADTGCRSEPGAVAASDSPVAADAVAEQRTEVLLTTLRADASAETHTYRVPCPDGGFISTVEAHATLPATTAPLDVMLAPTLPRDTAGSARAVSTPDLVYFRVGSVSVIARTVDDDLLIAATTTPC